MIPEFKQDKDVLEYIWSISVNEFKPRRVGLVIIGRNPLENNESRYALVLLFESNLT